MILNVVIKLNVNGRFFKFLCIGVLNTAVCIAIFIGLNAIGLNYLLSSSLMNIFGVVEGYTLNAIFLYRTKLSYRDLFKYFNVYVVAFFLNMLLMYLLVSCLNIQKLLSQLITALILAILNYHIIKLFVFKVQKL